jgi:hypothetical protein
MRDAVRLVTISAKERVLGRMKTFAYAIPMCAACAEYHEGKRPDPTPSAPISAPGSTVEDLENDLAALTMALRLAEYGNDCCERDAVPGNDPSKANPHSAARADRDVARLYNDGAGAFEASALVVWLQERIAETENTIDGLTGAGPPVPGRAPGETLRGGIEAVRAIAAAWVSGNLAQAVNDARLWADYAEGEVGR